MLASQNFTKWAHSCSGSQLKKQLSPLCSLLRGPSSCRTEYSSHIHLGQIHSEQLPLCTFNKALLLLREKKEGKEEGRKGNGRTLTHRPTVRITTPYLKHHRTLVLFLNLCKWKYPYYVLCFGIFYTIECCKNRKTTFYYSVLFISADKTSSRMKQRSLCV